MAVNQNNYLKDKDATIIDLINQYNKLEDRFKKMERMLTAHPGDYRKSTLLGVKTFEGKVETYSVEDLINFIDAINPDDL